ncbi:STM3941 family protein [Promicromonospora panici]|uniref:STM3941 family protein n=1 Tax=Promicromonospora panici TaxID=2219658 RepID=UPI00101D94B3|nr:STM3941 family protein [Promicromonospora panici]
MPDESVDFYPSRAHVLTLALAALALVVVCAIAARLGFDIAQTSGSRAALAAVSVSATGVLVFTGLGLLVVRRLLLPTWPVLTLDGDGLTDWLPNLGVEQVLWSEVTCVRETRVAFRRVLAVDVADPKAVVGRQRTVLRRAVAAANTRLVGTPVVLKPGSINCTMADLEAAFERFTQPDPAVARA